jgi:hypothetical protein
MGCHVFVIDKDSYVSSKEKKWVTELCLAARKPLPPRGETASQPDFSAQPPSPDVTDWRVQPL